MKKKFALINILIILIVSVISDGGVTLGEENETAWVLVETYEYPVSEYFNDKGFWNYYGSYENGVIDIKITSDEKDPVDLHGKYTWDTPPRIIKANEIVTTRLHQEVISSIVKDYGVSLNPYMKIDAADLELGFATSSKINSTAKYPDGTMADKYWLHPNGDPQFQKDTWIDLSVEFYGKKDIGSRVAIYIAVSAGTPGSLGKRYTYEYKEVKRVGEAFDSGVRIMWDTFDGLGYRVYRSENKNEIGISVTDFYITSTSFADVNVEANTIYYYTVKSVLVEANPLKGIEEKLSDAIATSVISTGNIIYKQGSYKKFIILKIDNPNLTIDGISQEIDPGRGTSPTIISGRTMIPIASVVEALGGTVTWDGETKKVTLNARNNIVEMWLGKTDIMINGKMTKMDVAPVSKNGRTFVPVKFAAENLNCKVDWINSTREVVIIYEE